jgi:hypothetical protein
LALTFFITWRFAILFCNLEADNRRHDRQ